MPLHRIRRVMLAASAILLLLLVAGSVMATVRHVNQRRTEQVQAPLAVGTALQRAKLVPDVPLVGADGKPTSLASYRGKWVVLAPSMTLCQEVCPMTTGALNELQRDLRRDDLGSQVDVVEATVDPWRDTPERLRAYAKLADIHFGQLTGSPRDIQQLWKFFGVYFHRVAEGHPADIDWMTHKPLTYDVDHTDGIFIIDPGGHLRVVDEGMPKLDGPLPKPLEALLDAEGHRNLAHPELPWTAAEIVDDLDFELGREIPASQAPHVHAVTLATARRQLSGSPRALAVLHTQADQLLAGGVPALSARLAALRGHPVVVNIWASWCGNCRGEYPILASASARYGRQVAFLGVDVDDSAHDAHAFLAAHPVSYPSYAGSSDQLGALSNGQGEPITVYIAPDGKIVHRNVGAYDTLSALENDIEHYALGVKG